MPNMDSIQLKTNELLIFQSGCHGNQVHITTWYKVDAYYPKNIYAKYRLKMTQDKGVIDVSLWLPW